MGSLLVVTGPPGAGKSTVAAVVADRLDPSVLVDGDAFFGFVRRGYIDPWLPASNTQNGVITDAAAAGTGAYVRGGFHTVYDGVVGPWFLDSFLKAAGLHQVDYVVLMPDADRCAHRVAARIGHGFTDEAAARHMHAEFSTASLDPRHVLDDPSDGVERLADVIMNARSSGSLRYRLGRAPDAGAAPTAQGTAPDGSTRTLSDQWPGPRGT